MNSLETYLLLALPAHPFLGALAIIAIPNTRSELIHHWSALIAFFGLALTIYLFVIYDSSIGGTQFQSTYPWLESLGIQMNSGLTGIAAPLILLNGIVFFAAVFISHGTHDRPKEFYVLLMLLSAGVYGVFISIDLFFFFFFYELAVVPMYLLI